MKCEYAEDICDALKDRSTWETRQETWYKMRHNGLRRMSPPYPGAADLHFPLIDTLMERMKPFYYKQLFATDQFAAFISLRTQPSDTTSAVASWFDYRIKQKSNFQRKILTTIDAMLMAGRAPIKIYWDFEEKDKNGRVTKPGYVCFTAVAPTYFIIPSDCDEINDEYGRPSAPWVVHVMCMSVDAYKKNENFRQDPDFIERIRGDKASDMGISGMGTFYDTIKRREGITYTKNNNEIIIWEIYRKDGNRVCFDTYSPACLEETDAVRPTQYLPYNHGGYPFVGLRSEIKDEGWYAPRGLPEIVAAFEDSLCRQWNFKHDYMDFVNKPLFTNEAGMTNSGNVTVLPGSTLPQGLKPAVMPAPPISFDQEMQMTRALAEYRVAIPDLGATEHLQGGRGSKGNVTATQIDAIIGQSGLSDDMRSRVFRLDLADLYRMVWSLYKQYDSASLTYVLYDSVGEVPPDALHGEYEIMPNGAADSWNKPQQLQKAVARLQLLGQSPFWKRNELEKNFVEIDDPRLIKRAYTDPGIEQGNQMEWQAQEISIMLLGFPAAVKPSDDDVAHLQSLQGFIDAEIAQKKPIEPKFARLALGHIQGHLQGLDQKKNPNLNQIRQQVAPLIDYLQSLATLDQQPQQMPGNVVPGPGMGASTAEPPSITDQSKTMVDQSKIQSDRVSDATSIANAFANLAKAGVPVAIADVNAVLTKMGLPPITHPDAAVRVPTQPDAPENPQPTKESAANE